MQFDSELAVAVVQFSYFEVGPIEATVDNLSNDEDMKDGDSSYRQHRSY